MRKISGFRLDFTNVSSNTIFVAPGSKILDIKKRESYEPTYDIFFLDMNTADAPTEIEFLHFRPGDFLPDEVQVDRSWIFGSGPWTTVIFEVVRWNA